ncbi:MAG: xanthine dehydrogenase family protein subunit M [Deltaproteobacteria bacterium]|nr:xanthine dehydrogenase family protein subunit M [Deltaproteobacteria bacterium]
MSVLPRFEHHAPTTLDEALELKASLGQHVWVLAGGTEIIPKLRAGRPAPDHLISINGIEDLRPVTFGLEGETDEPGLSIGGGARVRDVADHPAVRERYPALLAACTQMATVQIRNMATVAGNLVNGSPCADTAGPLLANDARLTLAAKGGGRVVALKDFFTGPGQVDLQEGEILVRIGLPVPPARCGEAFLRLSARSKVDIAAASATARLVLAEDGRIEEARVVIGAVAPTPLRCRDAEASLVGEVPGDEAFREAARLARDAARPIDDVRATAAYRKAVVPVLVRRTLEKALERARAGGAA